VVGYATPSTFVEYARKGRPASIAEIDSSKIEAEVEGGAFLLDVRRAAEIADRGSIPGAHNIAHERLLERLGEVPKNRPVVVHCQMGARSTYAAGLLDRMGYTVTNVTGGFEAWRKSNGGAAVAKGSAEEPCTVVYGAGAAGCPGRALRSGHDVLSARGAGRHHPRGRRD
jgi:hydroxyacylglutathione hydrolase